MNTQDPRPEPVTALTPSKASAALFRVMQEHGIVGRHRQAVEDAARNLAVAVRDEAVATLHEREHGRTIDQRDAAEEWADRLADAIAGYFGEDIGEHSNANDPWRNALEAFPVATRDEELRQALEAEDALTTAFIDSLMGRIYKDGGAEPLRTSMDYDEVEQALHAIASSARAAVLALLEEHR